MSALGITSDIARFSIVVGRLDTIQRYKFMEHGESSAKVTRDLDRTPLS